MWGRHVQAGTILHHPFLFSPIETPGTSLAQKSKPRQRCGHPPDSLPAPSLDSPEAACEACPALASQCRPFPAWTPRAGWTSSSPRSSSLLCGAGGGEGAGKPAVRAPTLGAAALGAEAPSGSAGAAGSKCGCLRGAAPHPPSAHFLICLVF